VNSGWKPAPISISDPTRLEHPGRGREDPREQLQQRGLARAVGADDSERLARPDVEVDVAQSPDLPRPRQLAPEQGRLQRAILREADQKSASDPAAVDLAGCDGGAVAQSSIAIRSS
jgi:hypothetical protein